MSKFDISSIKVFNPNDIDQRNYYEELVLFSADKCEQNDLIRSKIFQLNIDELSNLSTFDSHVQQHLSCLASAVLSDEDESTEELRRDWMNQFNRLVRNYQQSQEISVNEINIMNKFARNILLYPTLRSLTQKMPIISDSSNYVFQIENQGKPLFTIKSGEQSENFSIHEAFVGMVCLNNLRSKLPTFMHTYGVFQGTESINDEKYITDFCPLHYDDTIYIMIEYINGTRLMDLIPSLSPIEYFNIYMQIINALYVAQFYYQFAHYDLHTDNVLITILPTPIDIPYYPLSGKYIRTKYLARIIDFGQSHVVVNGQHFGPIGLSHFNRYSDACIELQDIYLFMMWSYNKRNPSVDELLSRLYSYFGSDRIQNHLHEQDSGYPVPFNGKLGNLIDYLHNHFSSELSQIIIDEDKVQELAICRTNCQSWDTFIAKIFTLEPNIQNLIQCNLSYLEAEKSQNEFLISRLNSINILSLYREEIKGVKNYLLDVPIVPQDQYLSEEDLLTNGTILDQSNYYILLQIESWIANVVSLFTRRHQLNLVVNDLIEINNEIRNKISIKL